MFGKSGHIGISVSDTSIEIIEIRPGNSGLFSISGFVFSELEQGVIENGKLLDADRFSIAIKNAFEKGGTKFSSKNIYFIIPDPITFFHTFVFPGALPDKEIPNAISFKFEETFPIPLTDAQGDYAVVVRNPEKTIVQYAASSRNTVEKYLEALRKAGLNVDGMGLEAQAILRVVLGEPREKKASLIAHVTERSATFFIRDILGINSTFYATFKGFEDSREKIVLDEMNSVLQWYKKNFAENDLDVIVVSGNAIYGLKAKLEKAYPEMNVRIADFFGKITNKDKVKDIEKYSEKTSFVIALGASLQDIVPCGRKFELMPGAKCLPSVVKSKFITSAGDNNISFGGGEGISLYVSAMSQKKKFGITLAFIFICIAFLGGVYVWYYMSNQKIDSEIQKLKDVHAFLPTEANAEHEPQATSSVEQQAPSTLPGN